MSSVSVSVDHEHLSDLTKITSFFFEPLIFLDCTPCPVRDSVGQPRFNIIVVRRLLDGLLCTKACCCFGGRAGTVLGESTATEAREGGTSPRRRGRRGWQGRHPLYGGEGEGKRLSFCSGGGHGAWICLCWLRPLSVQGSGGTVATHRERPAMPSGLLCG